MAGHGAGRGGSGRRARAARAGSGLCAVLALAACGGPGLLPGRGGGPEADADVYRRAEVARIESLEREVERLRSELREAEQSILGIESGRRGEQVRAEAVSALAEARIAVERARSTAAWRKREIREAQAKLDEAERQFEAGHAGTALFFAQRARRDADGLHEEVARITREPSTRFVRAARANVRVEPTTASAVLEVVAGGSPVVAERQAGAWLLVRTPGGSVGWIYAPLVERR